MVSANPNSLTPQEQAVFRCVMRGMDNADIAAELGIAAATTRNHLDSIRRKLGGEGKGHRWWVWVGRAYERQLLAAELQNPTNPSTIC